jgi:hypothetical protein
MLRAAFALITVMAVPSLATAQPNQPSRDFLVVLNEDAGPPQAVAESIAGIHGGRVGYVYEHALNGFSITLPLAAVAAVQNRPDVAYVERDLPVSIVAQVVPSGIERAVSILISTSPAGPIARFARVVGPSHATTAAWRAKVTVATTITITAPTSREQSAPWTMASASSASRPVPGSGQ